MRWIVESSLRLAAFIAVGVVVLVIMGVIALRHAPVDTLPEFLPPQVQVQTEALGLSTTEVEQFITVPLEDEFNGLPFLDHLRSQSVPGLSSIELTFKPGTDIYKARQLVTERVAQGPSVVNVGTPPVMIQPLSAESRVMMIGLSAKGLPLIDLSTLARWRIRPRLLAVPGVANVTIWGQRDQQLQVLVDPARMAEHGVSLEQVINTAGDAMWTSPLTFVEASSPGADGFIDIPNQRLSVQHILPIRTAKDLAEVPIEDTTDKPLRLGEVATVVEDHPPLRGDAVLKSGPGFILVVEKFPGANTLAVTRGVETAMAELEPGLAGVTVDTTIFRPATYMETALHDIGIAVLIAFALVVLWLGVAARSWRTALIGAVVVVLPVIVAAGVLYLYGATFNTMTLAGLVVALGVIIDDAVVGVAAMRRRQERQGGPGEEAESKAAIITAACLAVRRPLGYALAIIALAAIPLVLLSGLGGSFARPMMASYLLAVLASTATALIVTPVLGYLLLGSKPADLRSGLVARWVERGFKRSVPGFLRRPHYAYATTGLLVAVGVVTLLQLGTGRLIPALQDRDLLIEWQAMPGTSLPEMERITTIADRTLRSTRGVRDIASHMGQALMGDQVVDVDSAETWIRIDQAVDYDRTVAAIQREIAGFAGLRHSLVTYSRASLDAAPTTSGAAVTVRLYGTDGKTLAAVAQRIRRWLAAQSGIVDPQVQAQPEEPAIQIEANVKAAARYGLKPGDIRRQTSVLIAGIPVGSYYQDQQIFDVTVWSEPVVRQNLTDIQRLLLDTPNGGHVPLWKVATVAIEPAPTEIDHDQMSRFLDVTAGVKGADLGSVLASVKQHVQKVELPLGSHAEVSSGLQQRQNAHRRTLLYALMAVAAILLLLQAAFQSWRRAALLLVTLPLAAIGGLVVALFAGRLLTVGALIGFITVFTIALRNGILLIHRLRRQEREHPESTELELVERATGETAFVVVVAAVALALGVLPFVMRGTIPGMEVLRPLGLVVVGGLVTSTVYSLFILPALYLRFAAPAPAAGPATQRQKGAS
ncbi:MAG: efflux RND transporter permease subunit [Gaiellaceae bacterium]|jgi:CzcA family heavy metal efflux pump